MSVFKLFPGDQMEAAAIVQALPKIPTKADLQEARRLFSLSDVGEVVHFDQVVRLRG